MLCEIFFYSASAEEYLPLVFIPTLRRTYFFNSALPQEHIFSNSATISSSPLRVTNRTPDSEASEYDSPADYNMRGISYVYYIGTQLTAPNDRHTDWLCSVAVLMHWCGLLWQR
jgi:hypothetical protein